MGADKKGIVITGGNQPEMQKRIYVLQVECEKDLMPSVDEVIAVAATSVQMVTHTVMPDILSFEDQSGDFYEGLHKRLTDLKAAGGNEQ